jgi:tRNA(His) 5'-end guanylyltransferase
MKTVKFIDRPCGTGKTSSMIESFEAGKHYFVVVPTIDEVQRVLKDSKVPFTQPEELLNTDTATCNCLTSALMGPNRAI